VTGGHHVRRSARARRRAPAAALIALTGVALTTLGPPAVAAARPASDCTSTAGAMVVVDFGRWGGPLLRACGSTPTTGYALLNQGGWHTSGTEHDGPGFICRIGYAGFRHGTLYPAPGQQPCVNTPPASAYWTYWQAGPGQDTWSYNQLGAMGYNPRPGSISLWVFGGTNIAGTTGTAVPAMTPASLRAAVPGRNGLAVINAAPVAAAPPASSGSATPSLIAIGAAVFLAAAGTAVRRRRRGRSGQ